MQKPKALFRMGIVAVLVFSIILCSFTTGLVRQGALATPFQTLPPVNATFATPIGVLTPVPTPMSTVGPGDSLIYIVGDSLIVGSDTYPIGDIFLNPGEIPLGAETTSMLSDFGYADIKGMEDF